MLFGGAEELGGAEADLQEDGFTERFKFDSTPPRRDVLLGTPSLEDYQSHMLLPLLSVMTKKV